MLSFTDTYKISKEAFNALKKIRENKTPPIIEEILPPKRKKFKLQNNNFNEYSDKAFDEKIKLDMYIYNKLINNISESEKEYISNLLIEMFEDIKNVYKFINYEPKNIGFKNLDSGSSKGDLIKEAGDIINNFLKNEFYDLTLNERKIKYENKVIFSAINLVQEDNIKIDEAVEHSYKTAIIEDLIYKISFPSMIKYKIEEAKDDSLYNDFFDMERFNSILESFENKKKILARIISVLI